MGSRTPLFAGTYSRREVLKGGAAALGAASLLHRFPFDALALATTPGRLTDIQHVIFFMQENRSFDHYFGTYPAVRGFADPSALPGVFQQAFTPNTALAPAGILEPYHLDTSAAGGGECTPDPPHGYGTQHACWDNGAMDKWGVAHAADADWSFMGYYTRADLSFYYAVADAFTLCDAYHCSVMGSTTSNRLYALTGMIDPQGLYGGPVRSTISWNPLNRGTLKPGWVTYPELLTDAGVSWKCYADPDSDYQDNPLVNFQQYYPGNPGVDPVRAAKLSASLFGQTFQDFLHDAAAGTLPQVSWVLAHANQSEHPSFAPQDGEVALQLVLQALAANPLSWPQSALFYTYDENGGFFDHVPPPTPALGINTPGEFCYDDPTFTTPIGLGFRVPMLVISPFSRGGFVSRDLFDHTSQLLFLESWLKAQGLTFAVPNLSPWRRATVGNLTSAFNFIAPNASVPALPTVAPVIIADHPECATEELTSAPSPHPSTQSMPGQEAGSRPSPSGP